ncbi:unnamed protein product [Periconia digitata]|uniref:Uncharacterized protein n=1 Tax=Periconia digitata TaxID=1303443 RepID=A0A9W4U6I0_9PLEO|nr:unnamed protein product [Periconia digitata]
MYPSMYKVHVHVHVTDAFPPLLAFTALEPNQKSIPASNSYITYIRINTYTRPTESMQHLTKNKNYRLASRFLLHAYTRNLLLANLITWDYEKGKKNFKKKKKGRPAN